MYGSQDFEIITDIFKENVPGLKTLVLFGSYSRGTATDESDADVAAIVDREITREEKLHILGKLWNILGKKGYCVDIILKNENQFNQDKTINFTVSHSINSDGKILWMRN